MAGRNNIPIPHPGLRRHHHHPLDDPRPHPPQGFLPPPEVHLMEERIASQSHEIRTLMIDNQRLAASHVALKQDVAAVQQEIRRLSATASSVKAEKDGQVREVYERYLKLEAEARSIEGLSVELERVRAEIKERLAEREELSEKLKELEGDVARNRPELQHLSELKAEIETVHREIQRGRFAIEYERNTHSYNLQVGEAMEKHLRSLTEEAESLRSVLANAGKGAMQAASAAVSTSNPDPGYTIPQINLEPAYGGNYLSDPYAVQQVTFDIGSDYAPGAGPQAPQILYDVHGQQIQG